MTEESGRYVTQEEMDSTITGQNMRAGAFVLPIVDHDPTSETRNVEDGAVKLWISDGQLRCSVFSLSLNAWTTLNEESAPAEVAPDDTTALSITMPATAFIAATATPDLAVRGSGSDFRRVPGWALDAATDESVSGVVYIPAWAEFSAAFYFAFSDATSGVAFMSYQWEVLSEGDQIDASANTALATLTASPSVADQLVVEEFTNNTEVAGSGGLVRVNVYRNATSVADTYAADVWFLGAVFTQTTP